MLTLQAMIGTEIIAFVPIFHKTQLQPLKLHNVEAGGIWAESQTIEEPILKRIGLTAIPKSAVFFLPFSQIVCILGSLDVPYISDEAVR